jgi:cytochrome oxidase Cu insertion factor (SCO1/SenC/PrrC family)
VVRALARILAAFALVAFALSFAPSRIGAAAPAAFVPQLHEGDAVPALPLLDQDGHAFSLQDLRGNAVVLSFIYTRCADARMCPLVSAKFGWMQHAIGAAPIRLVELTLDPAFDTPAVLRRYGAAYGQDRSRWTLATGSPAWLDELATRFGIATTLTRPGLIVHTEAAIVLDRDGRIATIVDGNSWTPAELLALAQTAAGASNDWIVRARVWLSSAIERCGGGVSAFSGAGVLTVLAVLTLVLGTVFARAARGPS